MWINLVRIIAIIKYTALKYLTPCGREKRSNVIFLNQIFHFRQKLFAKQTHPEPLNFLPKTHEKRHEKKRLQKRTKT